MAGLPKDRALQGNRLAALPRAAVRGFDTLLRRALGVQEFSSDNHCVFRIAMAKSDRDITLSDGTVVRKGEAIAELHLWNEHVPPMSDSGPYLAWAMRAYTLLVRSFRQLARYQAEHPQWAALPAWRGESSFVPKGLRVSEALVKLGFDLVPEERSPRRLRRFVQFWDNLYWWALAWTFNPASLSYKELLRLERWQVWISSAKLQERYGKRGQPQR